MVKVFIDGKEGTTGLKIFERLALRDDIEVIQIDEEKRKDSAERAKCINASDITFLCLPDVASIEAVSLCTNPNTKIIDASTAHRTNPDWAYGFPELSDEFRRKIENGKRVAVPGCHASGFLSIVYPLVSGGVLPADYPVVSHSISGYSGAGKKAIAQYEADDRDISLDSPRQYALSQNHKHLPEMQYIAGLKDKPLFNPFIVDYFSGMEVSIPLKMSLLKKVKSAKEVYEVLANHYKGQKMVAVEDHTGENAQSFLPANMLSGKNTMIIGVHGNDERIVITSVFDNLGKGASGAAMQCMNIMLGLDETSYLI